MGVCAIRLGKNRRRCLGTFLALMNMTIVILGLICMFSGIVVNFMIRQQRDMLKGYNYKKDVNFIIGMGATTMLLHFMAAKVCYDCGSTKHAETRKGFLLPLFIMLFVELCCFLALRVEAGNAVTKLTQGFQDGFQELMNSYGSNVRKKEEIDMMQRKYKCCGGVDYKDWLGMEWYSKEYLRPEVKKSESPSRGVPFSCCDSSYLGPCVHDIVEQKRPGYKLTGGKQFFNIGCGEAVMTNIKYLLNAISNWILFPFWLDLFMLILVKYLLTSINNALEAGDIKGPAWGYIIEHCPCTCCEFLECDTDENKKRKVSV